MAPACAARLAWWESVQQTGITWVTAAAASLPPRPAPVEAAIVKLDELFTVVGQEKSVYEAYRELHYRQAQYAIASGKSQTYSVEGVNADLRHYLARLGRRSRCFSRSVAALGRALSLFAYCYNARQLHKQCYPNERRYPKLTAHLIDTLPALN